MVVKFIFNLSVFSTLLNSEGFLYVRSLLKLGIYDYDTLLDLTLYMIPEILIIVFIMLNDIKLKLIGLYSKNENDIEPVVDALQRNIMKGDEEAVK
jgi:hypothetical protein